MRPVAMLAVLGLLGLEPDRMMYWSAFATTRRGVNVAEEMTRTYYPHAPQSLLSLLHTRRLTPSSG